jgi:hypothetical protein
MTKRSEQGRGLREGTCRQSSLRARLNRGYIPQRAYARYCGIYLRDSRKILSRKERKNPCADKHLRSRLSNVYPACAGLVRRDCGIHYVMPHRSNPLRSIALVYCVLVLGAAAWAVAVDMQMLHSQREHLLPDAVLMFIAMPASLTLGLLYESWPATFGSEFAQVGWATVCGFAQAGVVAALGSISSRGSNAA